MSNINLESFTLRQLASIVGGVVKGDPQVLLSGFNPDPLRATPQELCFAFSTKFLNMLNRGELRAGAYVVPADSQIAVDGSYLMVERPKLVIKRLLDALLPPRHGPAAGIHPTSIVDASAQIHPEARLGPNVYVGPASVLGKGSVLHAGVYIGAGVRIGCDCILKPLVVVEDGCILGDRVIVHPGSVIGSDGFSYVTETPTNFEMVPLKLRIDSALAKPNPLLKVQSAGYVEIGDDVEIGANTCIDRGTLGATKVGRGTKIDNLVQIAHNCQIGEECIIIGQAGLAGSVTLGDRVVIAGHAGCKDNISIAHDCILAAASHANKDAPPFTILGDNPAISSTEYIQREKTLRRVIVGFPKLKEEVERLKAHLGA